MVIDKIENAHLYSGLGEHLHKALKYLTEKDLTQVEPGRYDIEGDQIFALVQDYNTKEINEGKLEGHFKFIDVQYIVSGVECMGVVPLRDQVPHTISEEKDYAFYHDQVSYMKIDQGMFTIFFPDDLHMPGIKFNHTSPVRKVVVKVRI